MLFAEALGPIRRTYVPAGHKVGHAEHQNGPSRMLLEGRFALVAGEGFEPSTSGL